MVALLFSWVYVFMCFPNHLHMQRPTLPIFLVKEACVCLVLDKELWNVRADVFTYYICKSVVWFFAFCCFFFCLFCFFFFQKHVDVSFVTHVELTLDFLSIYFFFQYLNDFSSGSSKLQRPKEIIMKLYVFLVNTGTTLTFDTELAVQK